MYVRYFAVDVFLANFAGIDLYIQNPVSRCNTHL